jgi:hypothetical protein
MDTPQVHTIDVPDGVDWELIMRVTADRGFIAADEASAVNGCVQRIDQGHPAS